MDPVSLIVSAILAGASSAIADTAAQIVKDAYADLKSLLQRKLAGEPHAKSILENYERDPDLWQRPLENQLVKTGAGHDREVLRAAQHVLMLADPEGAQNGKYNVTISKSKGVVVGDHAQVTMSFDERD